MEGFGLRTLHWPGQNFPRFVLHSETSYLSFLPSLSLQRIKTIWSLGGRPHLLQVLLSFPSSISPVKWVVSTFQNYVKVPCSATLSSRLSPQQWLTALDMNVHSVCSKHITFQLCWFSPVTGHCQLVFSVKMYWSEVVKNTRMPLQ